MKFLSRFFVLLALFSGFEASAESSLKSFVGSYRSADGLVRARFTEAAIEARMGASAIEDSSPSHRKYDYYSLRIDDGFDTSEIDIYVDLKTQQLAVCAANHQPVVDPGLSPENSSKFFVYNQACRTQKSLTKELSYIERQMAAFKLGVALRLLANGDLQLTKYDIEQTWGIPTKQLKEVIVFNRLAN